MTAVSAGGSSAAAVSSSGQLYTWGDNTDGQLGIGSVGSQDTPQLVSVANPVTAVAVGVDHMVALDAENHVWASGSNSDLQLGQPASVSEEMSFTEVPSLSAVAIAAGGNESVAEQTGGSLVTFGANADGQLGNGNTVSEFQPQPMGIANPVDFSTGGDHTVVENADGTATGFGAGSAGQLGNAGVAAEDVPVPVSNWNATPGQVVAGGDHSLYLRSNGTVWASGNNSSGQLGDGNTTSAATPVEVSPATGLTDVVQVAAPASLGGGSFSLALDASGHVWTWGDDSLGQLGDGHAGSSYSQDQPGEIGGLADVVAIAAGEDFALALTASGTVYAWGDNSTGELGDGMVSQTPTDVPTAISTASLPGSVTAIAAGSGFQFAMAVTASGSVYTWGDDTYGELGNGHVGSSYSTATPAAISISGISGQAVSVAAGGDDAFVVDSSGGLFGFGDDSSGQLGFAGSYVATAARVTAVAAPVRQVSSCFATVVATRTGETLTFGLGEFGELGNGTTTGTDVPQLIAAAGNPASVSAGMFSTVVLQKQGGAVGFGYNEEGQLGNGTTTSESAPVAVSVWTSYVSPLASSYSYAYDGLRMAKTVGAVTDTFVWDTSGGVPVVLSDGTNDYLYGPDGRVVEQIDITANTADYLIDDQLGTPRVVENQAGAIVGTYTYDAMGNLVAHTGPGVTPIGYAGGYTDTETGLIYLQHRYYDPNTGTYLTLDPAVTQTMQPYQYAGNNPVNRVDPTGQSWCDWSPAGCGVLPGGNNGTMPNLGFSKFSLDPDVGGHNQCYNSGFACGYVWNPVVSYYQSSTVSDRTSQQAVDHLLKMLTGLYAKSENPGYSGPCQVSVQNCLDSVMIPGIAGVTGSDGVGALFAQSRDNSIMWWGLKVGISGTGAIKVADFIDLFDNLGEPFLELMSTTSGGCGASGTKAL